MQITHLVSGDIHSLQLRNRLSFLQLKMTKLQDALNQGRSPFQGRLLLPAPAPVAAIDWGQRE